MSQPNIPNITPNIALDRNDTVNLILSSIAMQELGLGHIINAEAEKIQYILGTLPRGGTLSRPTLNDITRVNRSVRDVLKEVFRTEMVLHSKMDSLKDFLGEDPRIIRPADPAANHDPAAAPVPANTPAAVPVPVITPAAPDSSAAAAAHSASSASLVMPPATDLKESRNHQRSRLFRTTKCKQRKKLKRRQLSPLKKSKAKRKNAPLSEAIKK